MVGSAALAAPAPRVLDGLWQRQPRALLEQRRDRAAWRSASSSGVGKARLVAGSARGTRRSRRRKRPASSSRSVSPWITTSSSSASTCTSVKPYCMRPRRAPHARRPPPRTNSARAAQNARARSRIGERPVEIRVREVALELGEKGLRLGRVADCSARRARGHCARPSGPARRLLGWRASGRAPSRSRRRRRPPHPGRRSRMPSNSPSAPKRSSSASGIAQQRAIARRERDRDHQDHARGRVASVALARAPWRGRRRRARGQPDMNANDSPESSRPPGTCRSSQSTRRRARCASVEAAHRSPGAPSPAPRSPGCRSRVRLSIAAA